MLISLAQRATSAIVAQWQAIDRDYRQPDAPAHHAPVVLLVSAVCLVLPRYFGQQTSLDKYPRLAELYAFLPYQQLHGNAHWALFKLINYALIPYLCMRWVLRRPLTDFGVRFVESRRALQVYAVMMAVMVPCVLFASTTDAFLRTYPKCQHAGDGFVPLLIWEALYGLQFLLLELFFRGFMAFALARVIGSLSLFVMVVPYAMIHGNKPLAECLGSILAGLALGTIALRTGSIWGGVLLHCGVAWSMDLLALARTGRWPTQLF
jgi:membrane protease YdiL (CAAX protease family)